MLDTADKLQKNLKGVRGGDKTLTDLVHKMRKPLEAMNTLGFRKRLERTRKIGISKGWKLKRKLKSQQETQREIELSKREIEISKREIGNSNGKREIENLK